MRPREAKCTFTGRPLEISFQPDLTAFRGRLLSRAPHGQPVLAGSFLRDRRIVLDSSLRGAELKRILLHELFHFAWIRLSNQQRNSYGLLIAREIEKHARGELGWSSEWRKQHGRPFREYVCESFCDTAAWRYGALRKHDEFTLANRWREKRRAWFDTIFGGNPVRI